MAWGEGQAQAEGSPQASAVRSLAAAGVPPELLRLLGTPEASWGCRPVSTGAVGSCITWQALSEPSHSRDEGAERSGGGSSGGRGLGSWAGGPELRLRPRPALGRRGRVAGCQQSPREGHFAHISENKVLKFLRLGHFCCRDSKIPKPPAGHQWKEVRSDNTVTWLASWTENIQNSIKYVMLNPSSKLKVRTAGGASLPGSPSWAPELGVHSGGWMRRPTPSLAFGKDFPEIGRN